MRIGDDRGFSLTSVLVAVGIVGIIAVALSTTVLNGVKGQKRVELKGELETMRRSLLEGLDCAASLPTAPSSCPCTDSAGTPGYTCPANAYFELQSKTAGRTMIGVNAGDVSAGKKIGSWYFRASCTPTQVVVEAARKGAGGAFLKDPLNGRLDSWAPLFKTPTLCSAYFGTSSSNVRNVSCTHTLVNNQPTSATWGCAAECDVDEVAIGGTADWGAVTKHFGETVRPNGPRAVWCAITIDKNTASPAWPAGRPICTSGSVDPATGNGCNSRCYAYCIKQ